MEQNDIIKILKDNGWQKFYPGAPFEPCPDEEYLEIAKLLSSQFQSSKVVEEKELLDAFTEHINRLPKMSDEYIEGQKLIQKYSQSQSVSHPNDGDKMELLFNELTEWQKETFPNATALSKIYHLQEEVGELIIDLQIDGSNRRLEFADIFLLAFGASKADGMNYQDVLNCIKEKLGICKKRNWGKPDANGVVKHISQPQHPIDKVGEQPVSVPIQDKKLNYIKILVPLAKKELDKIIELIGHDAVILTRLVQKVEEYQGQAVLPISDEELLNDLEDYLTDRADAEFDGQKYYPNKAMQLLSQIQSIKSQPINKVSDEETKK